MRSYKSLLRRPSATSAWLCSLISSTSNRAKRCALRCVSASSDDNPANGAAAAAGADAAALVAAATCAATGTSTTSAAASGSTATGAALCFGVCAANGSEKELTGCTGGASATGRGALVTVSMSFCACLRSEVTSIQALVAQTNNSREAASSTPFAPPSA